MEPVQIRLTKQLIEKTDALVDAGIYANRSEATRDAVRRLVFNDQLEIQKPRHTVLFTSDIHGNMEQYQKLFHKACEDEADTIIIGGDITPKDPENRTIQGQKAFLQKKLIPAIQEFKRALPNCNVLLILGNDDFRTNEKFLKEHEDEGYTLINNTSVTLENGFVIAGYPYVPLTPFVHKDWEKLDTNDIEESAYRTGYRIEGTIAEGKKLVPKALNPSIRTDTIEADLHTLLEGQDMRRTVLVTHSPPYETCLDLTSNNEHVGSLAVRRTIEKKQPLLTLHGHIHETVDMSGSFKELIGKTLSMSTGNYHDTKTVALLRFDLSDAIKAERLVI